MGRWGGRWAASLGVLGRSLAGPPNRTPQPYSPTSPSSAARTLPARSVLQMDSMLVTNQLCGRWHVVASDLVPYFRQANALLNRIRRRGVVIEIVHIYREFNKDADAKANMGADGTDAQHNW